MSIKSSTDKKDIEITDHQKIELPELKSLGPKEI
jgi:hypothetical protein